MEKDLRKDSLTKIMHEQIRALQASSLPAARDKFDHFPAQIRRVQVIRRRGSLALFYVVQLLCSSAAMPPSRLSMIIRGVDVLQRRTRLTVS